MDSIIKNVQYDLHSYQHSALIFVSGYVATGANYAKKVLWHWHLDILQDELVHHDVVPDDGIDQVTII
jgi:hypothetical protein